MKKNMLLFSLVCLASVTLAQPHRMPASKKQIIIETSHTALVYSVTDNQKLMQTWLGTKFSTPEDYGQLRRTQHEAYVPSGTDNLFEPAIRAVHNDNNPSLELLVTGDRQVKTGSGSITDITLKDPKYPFEVNLHIEAFYDEDVIKTHAVIRHSEKKPVVLSRFASAMLHLDADRYFLTQFHGDWAKEMRMEESQLTNGSKVIESKLGTRADMYATPVFFLATNNPATETSGEVIAGTLGWTGSFQLYFEIDNQNSLRILPGMNPFASEYALEPNQDFVTPEFIFTYSGSGKGQASRNLHNWARKYGVMDGNQPRLTLLNNWEATYFDFNEEKLTGLLNDAKKLGVDVFLLDDGWFANKYPRNDDQAGLGDWQANVQKLPHGIGYLVEQAEAKGVKFGIWIEPEMVNTKSELYEKHPDWILKLPNRDEHYYRNQLVLDLTNPEVQNFVFNVVDDLLLKNPKIGFIKWDCNRMMTNTYSPYLKDKQAHVQIEYVRSFYRIMERLRDKYPHLPIMLCSGGGGRVDYGALKYFTEFWPSDNTDAYERVFIQWGYSYFFPSITLCNHITTMGRQSLKFRTDVAMMGKMGYDIRINEMTPDELKFSQQAVQNYNRLKDVIWYGDLYRLVSPYEAERAVLMYVNGQKDHSVLFAYNLYPRTFDSFSPVRLQGLDPAKMYKVEEINQFEPFGEKPRAYPAMGAQTQVYSGDYLMKAGISIPAFGQLSSAVLEISEVK